MRVKTNIAVLLCCKFDLQGKEVFLQIHGMELRLLDPESSTVLSVQVINKIRVWGIGSENERYAID